MFDYYTTYRQYLEQGELRLQYCNSCQRFIFYPRSMCPFCWGESLTWRPVSGKGIVYSYTIIKVSSLPDFKEYTPYYYAIIEMDEGVRIPANLVDCQPHEVKVGIPVKLNIINRAGQKVAAFKTRTDG